MKKRTGGFIFFKRKFEQPYICRSRNISDSKQGVRFVKNEYH